MQKGTFRTGVADSANGVQTSTYDAAKNLTSRRRKGDIQGCFWE